MADFEIPEEPEYNRNIRRFETTDPAHADLFNAVAQTLINNDEFLKRTVEQQKETVLEKTGDAGDTTVTFTSGDTENPEDWTEITPVESGEKQSSLWQKISLFAKNLRYLWKLCGTSDISGVADGTLTGAVSKLNTDLQYKDISNEISTQNNYTAWCTAFIENGMVFISGVIPKGITGAVNFLKITEKYAPRLVTYGFISFPASGSDMNKVNCVTIDTDGNIGAWIGVALDYPVSFIFQYPLKRS